MTMQNTFLRSSACRRTRARRSAQWDPSNSRDNASAGLSGRQLIDGYRIDGTRLWRIDLGRNIRAGAHYTQVMVYDLDGDGRAEVACKTADGTVDGAGTMIGDAAKDYRSLIVPTDGIQVMATNDARYGKVLAGPEYFTVFDGATGAALATTSNEPIDGADDGNTSPDWEITGPLTVNLRADRSGAGTGRTYTIQVEGRDSAGNTTLQAVTVSVPLERE